MAMTPAQRAAKLRDTKAQYDDTGLIDLMREYLRYEHAKRNGLKPKYDNEALREMVDIHYEALREILVKRLDGDARRFDRMAAKVRAKLLVPLHYANP